MAILEGARDAFGRLGYAATRVEDILEAASVSRPTFYKHFANSREVFDHLREASFLSLHQALRAAVAEGEGPESTVSSSVRAFLDWRVREGAFGHVLEREGRPPGSLGARQWQEVIAAAEDLYRAHGPADPSSVDELTFLALLGAVERLGDVLCLMPKTADRADIANAVEAMMRIVRPVTGLSGASSARRRREEPPG